MQTISQIAADRIVPGNNDRTTFDTDELSDLSSSIKSYGLAQPITVRPVERCTECGTVYTTETAHEICPNCGNETFDDLYQIVAGERRFRACAQVLKMETVPAVVNDLNDEQASAIMLAENVSRADLDPIDEGMAYAHRIDTFGWSVSDCAEKAGVSSIRVLFRLKLINLRPEVQKLVRGNQLPIGYAQTLADGELDSNRQMIAISRLRDNPSPTPAWFRRVVMSLVEEQAQDSLFDTDTFFVAQELPQEPETFSEPAHPATTVPPAIGKTLSEVISGHITFWQAAAQEWEDLGKSFKRQECEAAAQALKLVLESA